MWCELFSVLETGVNNSNRNPEYINKPLCIIHKQVKISII